MSSQRNNSKIAVVLKDSVLPADFEFPYSGFSIYYVSRNPKNFDQTDANVIDITDLANEDAKKKILEEVASNPKAVICNTEEYMELKSYLCAAFNIKFVEHDHIDRTINKRTMRAALHDRSPTASPAFSVTTTEAELLQACQEIGFPAILKPSGLDRSMLVTKVDDQAQAIKAFQNIASEIKRVFGSRSGSGSSEIIYEEYMTGPKYSVEGFVDNESALSTPQTITDLYFGYDEGDDDPASRLQIIPSQQSDDFVREAIEFTQQVVTALDLKSCPIHAEIIHTENGFKLIEIAARIGGFRDKMYKLVYGYSLNDIDIANQLGDEARSKIAANDPHQHAATIKVYPQKTGTLKEVINEDLINNVGSFKFVKRMIKDGELAGPAKLGYKEIIWVILANKDRQKLIEDCDYIYQQVNPVIKATN